MSVESSDFPSQEDEDMEGNGAESSDFPSQEDEDMEVNGAESREPGDGMPQWQVALSTQVQSPQSFIENGESPVAGPSGKIGRELGSSLNTN
jgi:hypothetical protein